MTKRLPATAAPLPLEEYTAHFDDLFARRSQREPSAKRISSILRCLIGMPISSFR